MAFHHLFIEDLKLNLKGEVLSDEVSLGIYSTDASLYQIRPVVVVLPKTEQDVVSAVRMACDHQIAILPRGGGTSLAGQTVCAAMVLDFTKFMNQLLEVNNEKNWARVQPGIVRDVLNKELMQFGLHFAPDPATSSRATIGGMIANNSSGTRSIIYGKTLDHVLDLKVLLIDGTILNLSKKNKDEWEEKVNQKDREGEIYRCFTLLVDNHEEQIKTRFPKVMRRVGGYNLDEFLNSSTRNLSHLIVGSEGTLGVILEAKIKLEPNPAFKSVCVVHFETFQQGIAAVERTLDFGPSAVEILDRQVLSLASGNRIAKEQCHFLEGNPGSVLLVEFLGNDKEEALGKPNRMVEYLQSENIGYHYPIFPQGQEYEDVWAVRRKGLGLLMAKTGEKKPIAFIEDAAVPVNVLPQYIGEVLAVCARYDTEAAAYAHASVGVIHVRPMLNMKDQEDIDRFKSISAEVFELVKKYGGSWSGEHGDGLVRSAYNQRFFGEELYKAFREVKKIFDPNGLMNPGKIIEANPIDHDLRYGVKYKDSLLNGAYRYPVQGSFSEAVHMCTGIGTCRKKDVGTMCPSFMATMDEEHSTRGRANALRLAMSGQLKESITGNSIFEALDLCLSCKACKTECPSNVDMSRLKSEVLQWRRNEKGVRLRDRFIKQSAVMSRKFSGKKAGMINRLQASLPGKAVLSVLGFHKARTLPSYAHTSFVEWFGKHYKSLDNPKGMVVLFADTYLNYHEVNIGISAVKVLNYLGYEVEVADVGCCQRPRISNGFLKEASRDGGAMIEKLRPYLEKDIPILVCEPSCASAFTSDLPDLIEDVSLGEQIKNGVQPIELFLAKEMSEIDINYSGQILIHGHCHQKSLNGTGALHKILKVLKGASVMEIDSGCCGMAGAFGYEKEHFELSRKIGSDRLFPAIESSGEDSIIIANGFSCRHQIKDFTQRKARHFLEVLSDALPR